MGIAERKHRRQQVREALLGIGRVPLAHVPTPLHECKRLSAALGGTRILVKRDDLTGLAAGGNKVRNLEFLMGDAARQGADILVSGGFVQSNLARLVAAAGAQCGCRVVLVVSGSAGDVPQGNLLLDYLLGAEVREVRANSIGDIHGEMRAVAEELTRRGHRPYVVTGLEPVGMLGYVNCAVEMDEQLEVAGIVPDYVFVCSGLGTQAGLLVGASALGWQAKLVGVSPGPPAELVVERVREAARKVADILGLDVEMGEVISTDEYVGKDYLVPTPESIEAVRLLATTEGILLDPIYTGRAMAAVLDHVRCGRIGPDETAVFIHTGGMPVLFGYARHLSTG